MILKAYYIMYMSQNNGYVESFISIYHGTTKEAAESIIREGFIPSKGFNNWCGNGIYFYRSKSKAFWSANRTVREKKKENIFTESAVITADIKDIPRSEIFDMRTTADFKEFESFYIENGENYTGIRLDENEENNRVAFRALMICMFMKRYGQKLVVGFFKQKPQPEIAEISNFADNLDLIIGIEEILCVKDASILSNIR